MRIIKQNYLIKESQKTPDMCFSDLAWPKAAEYSRHCSPTDSEISGECGTVLKLSGVEQSLVVAGQFHPICAFLWNWPRFWFFRETGSPKENTRSPEIGVTS